MAGLLTRPAWVFLVARGRDTGYRTVAAPDFLVDLGLHGMLAQNAAVPEDPRRPTVLHLDLGSAGQLTVVHTAYTLGAEDLGATLSERFGRPPRDRHGRPLSLIYGLVLSGRLHGTPSADDLSEARSEALDHFRAFAENESRSQPFPTRAAPRSLLLQPDGPPTAASHPAPAGASDRASVKVAVISGIATVLAAVAGGVALYANGKGASNFTATAAHSSAKPFASPRAAPSPSDSATKAPPSPPSDPAADWHFKSSFSVKVGNNDFDGDGQSDFTTESGTAEVGIPPPAYVVGGLDVHKKPGLAACRANTGGQRFHAINLQGENTYWCLVTTGGRIALLRQTTAFNQALVLDVFVGDDTSADS